MSEITPTNSSLKTAGVKQTAGMLLLRAGFLNHISLKHQQNSPFKVQLPLQKYQYHYFPMVYEALERRGLVGPMELPETVDKQNNFSLHGDMDDYFEFLLRVQRLVNEGPTSNGMIDAPHKNVTLFSSIPSIDVMSPPSPISNQNASGTEDVRFSESSAEYSSLPSIIPDRSDLFLASMVEREADSWNLHLTTFLLDHRMLRKDKSNYGVRKIQHDVETYSLWAKAIVAFRRQKYQSSGARALNPRYFCRITTSSSDQPYVVQGVDYDACLVFNLFLSHCIVQRYHCEVFTSTHQDSLL